VNTTLNGKTFQDAENIKKNMTAGLIAALWRMLLFSEIFKQCNKYIQVEQK
jgi:hypothetical protein